MKASDISAFIQKKIANFNRTIFIDCLAIILLSYAIRCLTIGWHGFSDVEAQAIGIAKLSNINEITTACQQDGNPPLFHFLLYLWGTSLWLVRLLP